MSNIEQEHFYYVDPGIGKKRRGCPYTLYKDGRDIKTYITPPPGYEFTDFKLEPYPEDQFYDGKIVAQYKKSNVSNRVGLLIRKGLLFILYSIPIVVLLAIMAFFLRIIIWGPTPKTNVKPKPKKTIVVDTLAQKQVSDTSTIAEVITIEEPVSNEITALEDAKNQEVQEETSELESNLTQEPQQAVKSTKEQFGEEFWNLIHQQERNMESYFNLYTKYKNENLKSDEFLYLYLTILENTKKYKNWNAKLVKIPADEIKSINTISALTEKLEQYE